MGRAICGPQAVLTHAGKRARGDGGRAHGRGIGRRLEVIVVFFVRHGFRVAPGCTRCGLREGWRDRAQTLIGPAALSAVPARSLGR
jgi:hypothetical protein